MAESTWQSVKKIAVRGTIALTFAGVGYLGYQLRPVLDKSEIENLQNTVVRVPQLVIQKDPAKSAADVCASFIALSQDDFAQVRMAPEERAKCEAALNDPLAINQDYTPAQVLVRVGSLPVYDTNTPN